MNWLPDPERVPQNVKAREAVSLLIDCGMPVNLLSETGMLEVDASGMVHKNGAMLGVVESVTLEKAFTDGSSRLRIGGFKQVEAAQQLSVAAAYLNAAQTRAQTGRPEDVEELLVNGLQALNAAKRRSGASTLEVSALFTWVAAALDEAHAADINLMASYDWEGNLSKAGAGVTIAFAVDEMSRNLLPAYSACHAWVDTNRKLWDNAYKGRLLLEPVIRHELTQAAGLVMSCAAPNLELKDAADALDGLGLNWVTAKMSEGVPLKEALDKAWRETAHSRAMRLVENLESIHEALCADTRKVLVDLSWSAGGYGISSRIVPLIRAYAGPDTQCAVVPLAAGLAYRLLASRNPLRDPEDAFSSEAWFNPTLLALEMPATITLVEDGDTPAVLETAGKLYEPQGTGPLASLTEALNAARLLVGEGKAVTPEPKRHAKFN